MDIKKLAEASLKPEDLLPKTRAEVILASTEGKDAAEAKKIVLKGIEDIREEISALELNPAQEYDEAKMNELKENERVLHERIKTVDKPDDKKLTVKSNRASLKTASETCEAKSNTPVRDFVTEGAATMSTFAIGENAWLAAPPVIQAALAGEGGTAFYAALPWVGLGGLGALVGSQLGRKSGNWKKGALIGGGIGTAVDVATLGLTTTATATLVGLAAAAGGAAYFLYRGGKWLFSSNKPS